MPLSIQRYEPGTHVAALDPAVAVGPADVGEPGHAGPGIPPIRRLVAVDVGRLVVAERARRRTPQRRSSRSPAADAHGCRSARTDSDRCCRVCTDREHALPVAVRVRRKWVGDRLDRGQHAELTGECLRTRGPAITASSTPGPAARSCRRDRCCWLSSCCADDAACSCIMDPCPLRVSKFDSQRFDGDSPGP